MAYSEVGQNSQDVESNSLGERSALANGDLVSDFDSESGRAVDGQVLVSFLVSPVLGDEVQVVPSDDDGSVHLGGLDDTSQDSSSDGDVTGEGALLVCKKRDVSNVRSAIKEGRLECRWFSLFGPFCFPTRLHSSRYLRKPHHR